MHSRYLLIHENSCGSFPVPNSSSQIYLHLGSSLYFWQSPQVASQFAEIYLAAEPSHPPNAVTTEPQSVITSAQSLTSNEDEVRIKGVVDTMKTHALYGTH